MKLILGKHLQFVQQAYILIHTEQACYHVEGGGYLRHSQQSKDIALLLIFFFFILTFKITKIPKKASNKVPSQAF